MTNQKSWMNQTQAEIDAVLRKGLQRALTRHRELIPKLKDKSITPEEAEELREVNRFITAAEAALQKLKEQSPTHPKNILRWLGVPEDQL